MYEIKPIETRYRGRFFRSRLEARWAVFFDTANMPWEYEPCGFRIKTGNTTLHYLPDFYLREQDVYVEVKPLYPCGEDKEKIDGFVKTYGKMWVIVGFPYAEFDYGMGVSHEYYIENMWYDSKCKYVHEDKSILTICRRCDKAIGCEGIEYHFPELYPTGLGGGYGFCDCDPNNDHPAYAAHSRLVNAYNTASRHRFC